MKKTFFVVLMAVMIATPCLAEIETENLFSLDGTLWGMCTFEYTRDPFSSDVECESQVGFYQGEIYGYLYGQHGYFYIQVPSYYDLFLVSVAIYDNHALIGNESFFAIMQPGGLGVFYWNDCYFNVWAPDSSYCDYGIGIMFKINDHWTPPEVE